MILGGPPLAVAKLGTPERGRFQREVHRSLEPKLELWLGTDPFKLDEAGINIVRYGWL